MTVGYARHYYARHYYARQAQRQGVGCFGVKFPRVLRVVRVFPHVPLSQALAWEREGWRLVGT